MAHVWWHNCVTIGDSAGEVPLNLKAGKRGAGTNAFALPHGLTVEQQEALKKAADEKYMELVNLFRSPQESIVFHPVPDPPDPPK